MQPYGQDRVRSAGSRLMLHSQISKGWTPRVPKTGTHSAHPGTAVLWDGNHYEVIAAESRPDGGVTYVLSPWSEEHVIRHLAHYDEPSERWRIAESSARLAQQKQSVVVRVLAVLCGHLPAVVQHRIANRMGGSPSNLTVVSCIIPFAIFASFTFISIGALIEEKPSPLPGWFGLVAWYLFFESGIRFYVAMSQDRPVGSAVGFAAYLVWWLSALKARPDGSPFTPIKGHGSFKLAPSDEQEMHDRLETWGPLLSLLSAREQENLHTRFEFDYRVHAFGLTWTILLLSAAGFLTSAVKLAGGELSLSAWASLAVSGFIAAEQIGRLRMLRRKPAGSVLAVLVRPFLRRLFPAEDERGTPRAVE